MELLTVVVTYLNADGTEDMSRPPFSETLRVIGTIELTARQVWGEAGSPKPCTIEVTQPVADFNVDESGAFEEML